VALLALVCGIQNELRTLRAKAETKMLDAVAQVADADRRAQEARVLSEKLAVTKREAEGSLASVTLRQSDLNRQQVRVPRVVARLPLQRCVVFDFCWRLVASSFLLCRCPRLQRAMGDMLRAIKRLMHGLDRYTFPSPPSPDNPSNGRVLGLHVTSAGDSSTVDADGAATATLSDPTDPAVSLSLDHVLQVREALDTRLRGVLEAVARTRSAWNAFAEARRRQQADADAMTAAADDAKAAVEQREAAVRHAEEEVAALRRRVEHELADARDEWHSERRIAAAEAAASTAAVVEDAERAAAKLLAEAEDNAHAVMSNAQRHMDDCEKRMGRLHKQERECSARAKQVSVVRGAGLSLGLLFV